MEVTKIKINKKKGTFQIKGVKTDDKSIIKELKNSTKGSGGIPIKINPYYVKDEDNVVVKINGKGEVKSVKIMINGKYYKAKKSEWDYKDNTIYFTGNNLNGMRSLKK